MSDSATIVGGGFFGARIALLMARKGFDVVLLEREPVIMTRASFANQARVHNGYHYPRSVVTGRSSHLNYERFTTDYSDCVDWNVKSYYAVARHNSKITTSQFAEFCGRIGAPLHEAPASITKLFNPDLIDAVFAVTETVMNADLIRARLIADLERAGVQLRCGATALSAVAKSGAIEVEVVANERTERLRSDVLINCAYADLNGLVTRSGQPPIPLKHELAEIALVEVPPELRGVGVTVVDGPFFSVTPFPPRGLHALTHVRYTPHYEWTEMSGAARHDAFVSDPPPTASASRMLRDSERYLPVMKDARLVESLWEIKTVLPRSESNDGRPILFREVKELPGLFNVLGAKIDAIYDIESCVDEAIADGRMSTR